MKNDEKKIQAIIKWKQDYIDALIDKLHPSGNVLQVGFEIGHAAKKIQDFEPKSHCIIVNEEINEAKDWAKNYPNTSIIQGPWEEKLKETGKFDRIFFNDYPLFYEPEIIKRQLPNDAQMVATKAKELLDSLEEKFSDISVHFSDEEIENFYHARGKDHPQEFPGFLDNLKKRGFISEKQHKDNYKKFDLEKLAEEGKKNKEENKIVEFLVSCLSNHTHKGSRIACYMVDAVSRFEDPDFFDRIITNPNINYEEEVIKIEIPNCPYKEALIQVIERLD